MRRPTFIQTHFLLSPLGLLACPSICCQCAKRIQHSVMGSTAHLWGRVLRVLQPGLQREREASSQSSRAFRRTFPRAGSQGGGLSQTSLCGKWTCLPQNVSGTTSQAGLGAGGRREEDPCIMGWRTPLSLCALTHNNQALSAQKVPSPGANGWAMLLVEWLLGRVSPLPHPVDPPRSAPESPQSPGHPTSASLHTTSHNGCQTHMQDSHSC